MRCARRLPPAVLLAALTGCAALTVDVDVYKGPLANEVHVQTQQVAVMAIGAKPLLEQLQHQIESDAASTKTDWLRKLLDQILGLYRNRPQTPLQRDLSSVVRHGRHALEALDTFRASHGEDVTWHQLASKVKSDDTARKLADAYGRLLDGRTKDEAAIEGRPWTAVFETSPNLKAKLPGNRPIDTVPANTLWDVLADPDVVAKDAAALFDDADVQKRFASHVTTVAVSFARTRNEIRATVRAIAAALLSAERKDADLTGTARADLVESCARALSYLVSPDALLEATIWIAPDGLPPELTTFAQGVGPRYRPATSGLSAARDAVHAALDQYVRDAPAEAARGVLAADEALSTADFSGRMVAQPGRPADHLDKHKDPAWRRTGLAAGATEFAQSGVFTTGEIGEWLMRMDSLSRGLDGGRTDQGLEALIEAYLDVSKGRLGGPESDAVREARDKLLAALVHFTEKLRFLANNVLFVADGGDERSGDKIRKFQAVLEAIANTIQVHVNELDRTATHDAQLKTDREREQAGMDATTDPDPHTAVARFVAALENDTKAAEAELEVARRELAVAETARDAAKSEAAKAAAADALVKTRTEAVTTAAAEAERRKRVATRASAVRADVVERLAVTGSKASQRLVLGTFVVVLGTDETTENGKAGAALSRRAVVERPAPPKLASNQSSRDVLDQLIAALRHAETAAVADDGPDSPRARNIRAALAAAYEQRSGMIYLRPTSAYLRTSYAASALADNAGVAWRNQLERSSAVFVPFLDESIRNGDYGIFGKTERGHALDQRQAIDNQFWQSVNHVRVTGGGKTNYVVVKDDIGNWYVKGFSSDPKAMVQSAKNLALFNAGPARAALLARAGSDKAKQSLGNSGDVVDRSVLGGQLKRARDAYETKTRDLRKDMTDSLAKTIVADVTAAWQADAALAGVLDALKAAATSAETTQLADAKKDVSPQDKFDVLASGIADVLAAVKRFHHVTVANIDAGVVAPTRARVPELHKTTVDKERALATAQAEALKLHRAIPNPMPGTTDANYADAQKRLDDANHADGKVEEAQKALDAAKEGEQAAIAAREAAQTAADAAIRKLTDLVRAKLTDRIQKRDRAIAEYEAAIGVVSGAAER